MTTIANQSKMGFLQGTRRFCLALFFFYAGQSLMGMGYQVELFNNGIYETEILPARSLYISSGDASGLLRLLDQVAGLLTSGVIAEQFPGSRDILLESGRELGQILRKEKPVPSQFISPSPEQTRNDFCDGWVLPELVTCLCRQRYRTGEQPVEMGSGSGALARYLYRGSSWIEQAFTKGSLDGGAIKHAFGEPMYYFSKTELGILLAELDKVPPPEVQLLAEEYERLRSMVKKAIRSEGMVLLRLWT